MKNKVLSFVICILAYTSFFYSSAQSNQDNLFQIGTKDSVYSNILKENRKIWVQVPESANATTNHPNTYPVVYVLDGRVHFLSICAILNQLAPDTVPEMIVVGIENSENRTRDLTPTKVKEARGASDWVKDSGGGEKFTDFIAKELIPYIDKKYPTTTHKTLVGHSFGGLLVVNTVLNHPELFTNYIAIDPSLWWDNEVLSLQLSERLSDKKYERKSLFLSIANPLPPDTEKDLNVLVKDTTYRTEGLRATYKFSKIASKATHSTLQFSYKYYENENHGTVPMISIYDGLYALYPWYKMSGSFVNVLTNPDTDAKAVTKAFNDRYKTLSNHLGYTIHPEEDLLNNLGFMFMSNDPKKSFALFTMLIEAYPRNANGYDSMSDYYISQKDIKNAIKYVEMAYKISGGNYHKEKLEKLKKK
ncbi:alpha/beta hydrolase [Kordia sp. YSTF-M3]|uniref:Alpha/beta hydrolase n=1 Tax=Kordia aestuariivivens TaxID=2759037 RepID=A0ABR7Q9X7_9FLAO|nr:alpha/beta hydrolase-fold protein [Kordia aestuariivivens]MBC8755364.1 alpha/beta hydrolase [Kordia aestuariivivens]